MANFGPIRIDGNVSNVKTFEDLIRFVGAFANDVTKQFNGSLSYRPLWGVVGATGAILAGTNFGASFISAGAYYITPRTPFSSPYGVVVTPGSNASAYIYTAVASGFQVNTSANTSFTFIALGGR